jgi:2-polyprenyl-6-methoxyphenol hydroxylase-like FAD-dependent oxidoreductase
MHEVIVDYARSLGVEFKFGDKVVTYVSGERPSVITSSGVTYTGDVIIAADGPRSIARQQVLGLPDTKVNSGYAISRAYYTLTEEHKKKTLLKDFCDPTTDPPGSG